MGCSESKPEKATPPPKCPLDERPITAGDGCFGPIWVLKERLPEGWRGWGLVKPEVPTVVITGAPRTGCTSLCCSIRGKPMGPRTPVPVPYERDGEVLVRGEWKDGQGRCILRDASADPDGQVLVKGSGDTVEAHARNYKEGDIFILLVDDRPEEAKSLHAKIVEACPNAPVVVAVAHYDRGIWTIGAGEGIEIARGLKNAVAVIGVSAWTSDGSETLFRSVSALMRLPAMPRKPEGSGCCDGGGDYGSSSSNPADLAMQQNLWQHLHSGHSGGGAACAASAGHCHGGHSACAASAACHPTVSVGAGL